MPNKFHIKPQILLSDDRPVVFSFTNPSGFNGLLRDTEDLPYDERDARVLAEELYQRRNPPNPVRNWGITQLKLRRFSAENLENIYYGTNYLNIPLEVLKRLNPGEILAKYLGAGILKRCNVHLSNDQLRNIGFSSLIKKLDEVAFNEPGFRRQINSLPETYITYPGSEMQRIKNLNSQVKRRFCQSFWRRVEPSERECPGNANFEDLGTHRFYVREISRHLRHRYQATYRITI